MFRLKQALASLALSLVALVAQAVEVEGMQIDDQVTVGGVRLPLAAAAPRKRGYFKTDVMALYTTDKKVTPESFYKPNGPRRMTLTLLRDLPSATISRYFIGDFGQVATDAEFKQLINEVGKTGAIYGSLNRVVKGDVVAIDWVPGKGMQTFLNGKPLNDPAWNTPLYYEVFMRMFVGPIIPEETRVGLFGKTH
jgi:hypothetical protein